MKRVFMDTEFTNWSPRVERSLISIGLISEDGKTFYAEIVDFPLADCSDFVHAVVIPLLEGGDARMTMPELTTRLKAWIESFVEPIKLVTDWSFYDWVWIHDIFVEPGTWPSNLDGKPLVLNLINLNDADKYYEAIENAFTKGGLRRHHALDDAKANRLGWIAAGGDV